MIDFKTMEPVLNDSTPKWLIANEVYDKPISSDNIRKAARNDNEPPTKIKFELKEAGVWQCNKCGATTHAESAPSFCNDCERASSFSCVYPPINPDLWKLPKFKDIPVEDLDMLNTYYDLVKLVKQLLIFPYDIQYEVFVLWIISTWKTGCWDSVGFPVFRGFIDTGKTRALDIIRELGYRSVHAVNLTFPAMVRLTHFHNANILVDEIDANFNPKTEMGMQFLKFTKTSYRRGSKYTVADIDTSDGVKTYNNFGFKAFSGERRFDDAILSRALDFQMEKDYPEIPKLEFVQDELDHFQSILLNYRFKTDRPPKLGEDFVLRGRVREIFESIISTAKHIGIKTDHLIKYAQELEKEKEEDFRNTVEWDILKAIKEIECTETLLDAPEEITFKDLVEKMGWEWNGKTSQKLGYIFKKTLILKTKRKNTGTVLLLNHPKNTRKLKYLYRRYNV